MNDYDEIFGAPEPVRSANIAVLLRQGHERMKEPPRVGPRAGEGPPVRLGFAVAPDVEREWRAFEEHGRELRAGDLVVSEGAGGAMIFGRVMNYDGVLRVAHVP